ncbi:flagellar filament capping protein FliD [Pelagibius sp. Alg239-R121]|uniref:flagellar filament capping protein FliD n=1 Tax=Pelagibius sp. Alg239-R121 TaxID=2993448 RepID=UPI0024A6582C|nr:flagellar filament capping protein FliD [Pelagibius sp. Alg239-R121]
MALAGTQGTLSLSNGTPVLSGSFSGLDTAAVVEALVQAKSFPIVRLQQKISDNEIKSTAYTNLQTLVNNLQSAAEGLRNPPGLNGDLENVFEQKSAFLTSSSATAAGDIMGVTAANTAIAGIYEFEVQQIATAHKISGGTIADNTAAMGVAENLTIGLAGGTTANIAVTADMTLDSLVSAINSQSDVTGVRASSLKIADGDFRIVLTAEETNKAITFTGDAGGALATALGISADNGATFSNELETPQPAQVLVDGIPDPITRDSNEISDAITGLTFDLFKAEPGTTVQVEIDPDLTAVRGRIDAFVTAYNELRAFSLGQQQVNTEGEVSADSVLFGDNTLRTMESALGSDISGFTDNLLSGALTTLRDIGIELDSNNYLTVDSSTLDSALVSKLDEVRDLFEFSFTADSAKVAMISRSAQLSVGDFELNITGTDAGGNILGVSVTGHGNVFDIDGSRLVGIEGTAFEGMTLAYAATPSTGAETIQISTSLGFAEKIFQTADNYARSDGGLIAEQISTLGGLNEDYTTEIAKIEERMVAYRAFLLEKFAKMEQAVAFAENMTNQLKSFIESDR